MTNMHLERCEASTNMARYYNLSIVPGLFGDWSPRTPVGADRYGWAMPA